MRTRAKTWMLLLSILVAGTALMWPAEEKILVETATVQSGELVQSRLLTGVVQKEQKQYIISPKSGLISSVYVSSGQAVEAGQMLLRMDTSAEEKALSRLYLMRFEKANAVGELADQALALMSGAEDEWMANEAPCWLRCRLPPFVPMRPGKAWRGMCRKANTRRRARCWA